MSKSISIGFGIFALLLTALLVVPLFIDLNKWKPQIESMVSQSIGRDVHVDGDIEISILPFPGIALYSVRIANGKGGAAKDILKVDEVTATVSLLPLATKTLEFSQIRLTNPDVHLETTKTGQNNWDFVKNIKFDNDGPNLSIGGWTVSPMLPRINILQGSLYYNDVGSYYEISEFQLYLKSNSVSGPHTLKGHMILNKREVEFETRVGEIRDKDPIKLDIQIQAEGQRLQVIGGYTWGQQSFKGQLASKMNLVDLLGDLSPIQGDMTVAADIGLQNRLLDISNLVISSKDQKITGGIKLDLAEAALPARGTTKLDVSIKFKDMLPGPLNGKWDADLNLSAQGSSLSDMISHSTGTLNLNATEVSVPGFDAEKFISRINENTLSQDLNKDADAVGDFPLLNATDIKGKTKFDSVTGKVLLSRGVVNLQKIQFSGPQVSLEGTGIINLIGLGALVMFIFMYRSRNQENRLIPKGLFSNKTFVGSVIGYTVVEIIFSMSLVMVGLYLQNVLSYSVYESGIIFLAMTLAYGILSPLGGKMVDHMDPRIPAVIGLVTLAAGAGLGMFYTTNPDMIIILPSLVLIGIGLGIALPAYNAIMMKSVDSSILSTASGVFVMFAALGGSLGVVISTSLLVGLGEPILTQMTMQHGMDLSSVQLEHLLHVFGSAYRDLHILTGMNVNLAVKLMNEAFVKANWWNMLWGSVACAIALVMSIRMIKPVSKSAS